MGHLGFSYVGLVYLLMLFLPNILWARQRPQGYDEIVRDEPKSFLWLERLGQVSVTCCALVFADTNLRPISWWSIWLAASLCCMALYEMTWIRYFFSARNLR
ncbi:MAG: hypothetical protein U0M15_08745, partial [Bacillota bacterium]|nr:hypothetical protein [Bacillota bacterium]